MPAQLGGKGVRQGADAHLDAVSVLHEGRAVLADQHLRRRRLREVLGHQGRVILDQVVETADVDQVAVGVGNVRVDDGDTHLGRLDRRDRAVHGRAQGDIAVLVRTRDLDQRRTELDEALAVKFLAFAQVDRQVVGIAGIDVGPDIGTDEEALLEEDPLVPRLGVRGRSFRVEMMEVQVAYVPGVGTAAQGLDQDVRHAGDTAQMHMAMGRDVADGLIGGNEAEICHKSGYYLLNLGRQRY